MTRTALLVLAPAMIAGSAMATDIIASYDAPTFDRWNYPFAPSSGDRDRASTFGALNLAPPFENSFDDRDAQFLTSFITAGDVAPGLGSSNYVIKSATFTATLSGGDFIYDGTHDDLASYDGSGVDTDAGRPVELFGTGFRNGLNAFAYGEDFAFSFADPTQEGVRNAYATDYDGGAARDVSNNVRDGFEVMPFAVGQIVGAAQGDTIDGSQNQLVEFTLDLSNPNVVAYLQDSLNSGIVSLSLSSLAPASQMGPQLFPEFFTKDGGLIANPAPTLELSVEIVPAPASAGVLAMGGLLATRRRR